MRSSAAPAAVKTDAFSGVSKPVKMNIDTANKPVLRRCREQPTVFLLPKASTAKQDFGDGVAPGGGSD
jgi:hypothetical protein